jgi:hypothetical protein
MRKNQYEEALFRCEDDRFELDMCIETNASTLKKLRPLRDLFAGMSPEDRALWRLPENELGAIHFRAVERIYGDQVGLGCILRLSDSIRFGAYGCALEVQTVAQYHCGKASDGVAKCFTVTCLMLRVELLKKTPTVKADHAAVCLPLPAAYCVLFTNVRAHKSWSC